MDTLVKCNHDPGQLTETDGDKLRNQIHMFEISELWPKGTEFKTNRRRTCECGTHIYELIKVRRNK